MKRPKTFAAVMAAILITPALLALMVSLTLAQAGCVTASSVNINDGTTLRVRAAPVNGTILGSVTKANNPLHVINADPETCWYQIERPAGWNVESSAYWISYVSTYVSTVQPTPQKATETLAATVRPSVTPSPSPTPTRIITNTPLAPGYMATQAKVIARKVCWKEKDDPPESPGTCFLLPLDAVISDTVVQIQP